MKAQFGAHLLDGNFAPISAECTAPELHVREGKIPETLRGTLYRNGTNPMYPPLGDHHWFLSEGMVHGIHIENGRAAYRNRWVRTGQYEAQRRAGRRLVSTSLSEPSPPEGEGVRRHFAATHALVHGGRLLALDEWCGPAALDPETLETTIADYDFDGLHVGAFTAHPKVDYQTGEMLGYGYQADGIGSSTISYSIIDRTGRLTRHDRFQAPFCPIMHDFGITKEHVIFPLFSADINLERAANGGPLAAYDPSIGTHFGIMPRNGSTDLMRWFHGEPTYAYHTMNSYTERRDGREIVHLDMMKTPFVPLFPKEDGIIAEWVQGEETNGLLVRWSFDLSGNLDTYTETILTDLTGDFCMVDPRFVGLPYRHGFYAAQKGHGGPGAFFDTISHIDLETGDRRDYHEGAHVTFLEPIMVPRSEAAPEGDGWLLTLAYDATRNLSDLIIFDTRDILAGPVARVELPTRVPYGFHGSWHAQ